MICYIMLYTIIYHNTFSACFCVVRLGYKDAEFGVLNVWDVWGLRSRVEVLISGYEFIQFRGCRVV